MKNNTRYLYKILLLLVFFLYFLPNFEGYFQHNSYAQEEYGEETDSNSGSNSQSASSISSSSTIRPDPYLTNQPPLYRWTQTLGEIQNGIGTEYYRTVGVDSQNNFFVAGIFMNTVDVDPTAKQELKTAKGNYDLFLSKFKSDGTYLWTKTMGAPGSSVYPYNIEFDSKDNIYLGGSANGTVNFNTEGIVIKTSGSFDSFMAKYDNSGNFLWVKTVTSPFNSQFTDWSIDRSGNAYGFGYTNGAMNIDPGGTNQMVNSTGFVSTGNHDAVVVKYSSDGNFQWGKGIGGSSGDDGYGVATDSSNNVYLSGLFAGSVNFNAPTGNDIQIGTGSYSGFLSKYSTHGIYYWTRIIAGNSTVINESVDIDNQDNIYVSGQFSGTADFDPTNGLDNKIATGSRTAYITKYDQNGGYLWTKSFGAAAYVVVYKIKLDQDSNIYITGYFSGSADFDPLATGNLKVSKGGYDGFISKYNSEGKFLWAITTGGTLDDYQIQTAIDNSNNIYTVGYFNGTVDFDPSDGVDSKTSTGGYDGFFTKYVYDSNVMINDVTITIPEGFGFKNSNKSAVTNYKNILFSVSTLIPKINPNTSTPNRLQIHTADGKDIPLTYKTTANGYYIWEGEYRSMLKNDLSSLKGTVEGVAYKEPIGDTTHFSILNPGLKNVGATFDFEIKTATPGAYTFNNATDSAAVVYTLPEDGSQSDLSFIDQINNWVDWIYDYLYSILPL